MKKYWLTFIIVLSLAVSAYSADIRAGGGHQVIDQGVTTMPQQPKLNFTGPAVSCSNNDGESRTDCTFSQSGAPPPNLYVAGHTYPGELNYMETVPTSTSGWQTTTANCKFTTTCVAFDGVDDYMKVFGEDILPSGSSARTIEAWVYPTTLTQRGTIFAYGDNTNNNKFSIEMNGWGSSSMAGQNGTLVNTPTWLDGSPADECPDNQYGCISVASASSQYVRVPDYSAINFGTGNLTIMAWFKSSATTGVIVAKYGTTTANTYYVGRRSQDNKIWAFVRDGESDQAQVLGVGPDVLDNLWHHVAMVREGTTVTVYLDGTSIGSGTNAAMSDVNTSGRDLIIGALDTGTPSNFWNGGIDEVAIFNTNLTQTQIRTYCGWDGDDCANKDGYQMGGTEANMVGLWHLNEGTGTVASSSSSAGNAGRLLIHTNNNALGSTNVLPVNTWSHVAVTLNGTNTTLATAAKMYINGTQETLIAVAGMDSTGTINTTASNPSIGRETDRCMYAMAGCLFFDGVDDHVSVADHTSLKPSSAITLAGWVYRTAAQNGIVVSKNDNMGYSLVVDSQGWASYTNNGNPVYANKTIPLNRWTHLAVTHTGTVIKIYIDGVLDDVGSYTFVQDSSAGLVRIGAYSSAGWYFKGRLDDIRIYNTALARDKIWEMYRFGHGQACTGDLTGIVGCWKLDSTSGTTATDTTGTVNTYANDGTLTGFTSTTQDFDTDGWQNNGSFTGRIEEIRLWNTERTQAQISANKDAGAAGTESGLKLLYNFNDAATSTSTVIVQQSATVTGLGNDSNACTSSGSPCKTITGALTKIVSKFFSGNTTVHIASGVYPELVSIEGYHPAGPYIMTLIGYINPVMNSFSDGAGIFSGTSTGSNTTNFPKDARSLFNDTGKTFDKRVNETFLEITNGTYSGYMLPIENYWSSSQLSIISRYVLGSPTYKIHDKDHMAIIHGGAKPMIQPTGIGGAITSGIGRTNGLYIKDSSGINVKRLRISNTDQTGMYIVGSSLNVVTGMVADKINYPGFLFSLNSIVSDLYSNIVLNSYSGIQWEYATTIKDIHRNITNNTSNCGICNYFHSPAQGIYFNLMKGSSYACFNGEHSFFSYFYGYNRTDTCQSGVLIANLSMINLIYPITISNSDFGLSLQHSSHWTKFLQEGSASDIEIINNITGISYGNNSYSASDTAVGITLSGNTYDTQGQGLVIDANSIDVTAMSPASNQVYLYLKETGSTCELRGRLNDNTDTLISTLKAGVCP